MFRILSRVISDNNIKNTLRSLNLKIPTTDESPMETPEVPPPIPKKKKKITLKPQVQETFFSHNESFSKFRDLPREDLELPEELVKKNDEYNGPKNLLLKQTEAYQHYIKSMLEVPQEGVHFSVKDAGKEDAAIESNALRSYVSGMVRFRKSEGNSFHNSEIPEGAYGIGDVSQIKYYPGSTPSTTDELNAWARWYISKQPKELRSVEDGNWEPPDIEKERISDYERTLNQEANSNRRRKPKPDDSENENEKNEEKVNADNESESFAGGAKINKSQYFQGEAAEEFLERKHDIFDDLKSLPVQDFITSSNLTSISFSSTLESPDMLPPTPPTTSMDIVGFNNDLENWSVFRNIPHYYRALKDFDKINEITYTDKPWVPVRLPSVLNYFETLPNYYKNHRLVQGVTLCLERFHPNVSRKHKELLINQLCNLLTPRNPEKYMFLQEYFPEPEQDIDEAEEDMDGTHEGKSKKSLSDSSDGSSSDFEAQLARSIKIREKKRQKKLKEDEDQLEADEEENDDISDKSGNESSDYLSDDFDSSEEEEFEDDPEKLKEEDEELSPEQQLQNMLGEKITSNEDDDEEFDIVDRKIDWFTRNHENPDGMIPCTITFYDNNDGYWDHWIKIKRERAGLPEITVRTYLKH